MRVTTMNYYFQVFSLKYNDRFQYVRRKLLLGISYQRKYNHMYLLTQYKWELDAILDISKVCANWEPKVMKVYISGEGNVTLYATWNKNNRIIIITVLV